LVDERRFNAISFRVILSADAVVFLVSLLAYIIAITRWMPTITRYPYLYDMVGIGVLAFPLSLFLSFLYLGPG
jgi:hypothetical protein